MSDKGKFAKGGVIGLIVGAVAGLLFAPKSGKETRQDIASAASKAKSEAEKQLKKVYKDLDARKDEALKKADELKGKAKEELDELSKKADIVQAKVKELISALREGDVEDKDVKDAIDEGESLSDKISKALKK